MPPTNAINRNGAAARHHSFAKRWDFISASWAWPPCRSAFSRSWPVHRDGDRRLPAPVGRVLHQFPSRRAGQAGIVSAWVGSLLVMLVTACSPFPLGIASAIYLEEYARKNWLTDGHRNQHHQPGGRPSIVYGLLALGLFVYTFGLAEHSVGRADAGAADPADCDRGHARGLARHSADRARGRLRLWRRKWQVCSDHLIPYGMPVSDGRDHRPVARHRRDSAIITIGALTFIAFCHRCPSPGGGRHV